MNNIYVIMAGKIGKPGSNELWFKPVAVRNSKRKATAEKDRLQKLHKKNEYWIEPVKA